LTIVPRFRRFWAERLATVSPTRATVASVREENVLCFMVLLLLNLL
jgi:hypothetical protein